MDLAGAQGEVRRALEAFVSTDRGRSVAVRSLRGPAVEVLIGADVLRPAASIAKLPLVAAVYAAAADGVVDLDALVARGELPATAYPSVLAAFASHRTLSIRELCALCLITSDNPAAEHLLAIVGLAAVRRAAATLGAPDMQIAVGFADQHLDHAGLANRITARQALNLLQAFHALAQPRRPCGGVAEQPAQHADRAAPARRCPRAPQDRVVARGGQ